MCSSDLSAGAVQVHDSRAIKRGRDRHAAIVFVVVGPVHVFPLAVSSRFDYPSTLSVKVSILFWQFADHHPVAAALVNRGNDLAHLQFRDLTVIDPPCRQRVKD